MSRAWVVRQFGRLNLSVKIIQASTESVKIENVIPTPPNKINTIKSTFAFAEVRDLGLPLSQG